MCSLLHWCSLNRTLEIGSVIVYQHLMPTSGLPHFQLIKNKCIISTCTNPAKPDSVYCSEQCIVKHADESLVALEHEKQLRYGSKAVGSLVFVSLKKITHVGNISQNGN